MKVHELAAGRAGDKGDTLDLTLVAYDDAGFAVLRDSVTAGVVEGWIGQVAPGPVRRYEIPGLRALKYVAPAALPGGVYNSLRAGVHWQKAAVWLLLDRELPQ